MMSFAYGVDLGLLTQLEQMGYQWCNEDGDVCDLFLILKHKGVNAVRLRVFVNPPENAYWTKKDGSRCALGYCNPQQVLQAARRVKEQGMNLMIDFHYSDHYADPQYQDIPIQWINDDQKSIVDRIRKHTMDFMRMLSNDGIVPDWVQIGNEINNGILWPYGSFPQQSSMLTTYLNCGYESVKDVFPNCEIITHLTAIQKPEIIEPFLDWHFANGGKTDIIGFSHYPHWFNLMGSQSEDKPVERNAEYLYTFLKRYQEKYAHPVMIVEIGELESEEELSYELLNETIQALKKLPSDMGRGVFWWEPEVNSAILPDHYPLGAAKIHQNHVLQFTKALDAYRDNQ